MQLTESQNMRKNMWKFANRIISPPSNTDSSPRVKINCWGTFEHLNNKMKNEDCAV